MCIVRTKEMLYKVETCRPFGRCCDANICAGMVEEGAGHAGRAGARAIPRDIAGTRMRQLRTSTVRTSTSRLQTNWSKTGWDW